MSGIESARPTGDSHRYGILVVDDESAILESLELTLGSEYQIFTASSGERGLRSRSTSGA